MTMQFALTEEKQNGRRKKGCKIFSAFFVVTIIISLLVVVGMAVGVLVSQMNNMGAGFNGSRSIRISTQNSSVVLRAKKSGRNQTDRTRAGWTVWLLFGKK